MFQPQSSYEFYSPTKVLSGNKALENLPVELAGMDAVKPLVLTTPGLSARGMDKVLSAAFGDSNLTIGIFAGIPRDPDLKLLRSLYGLYRENGYDALIALGGGPVLDMAKALNIAVSGRPEDLEAVAGGGEGTAKKWRPLAAVLNLHISGYEMTRYAVLGTLALSAPAAIPDLLFIDRRTVPAEDRKTVAASALVSITQAVEAFLHPRRNHLTDAYAYGAIRFVMENIHIALKKPADDKGRLAMANAAFFAQTAFDNLSGGVVFSLGMALSRICPLNAGFLMGLLLPHSLLLEMTKESSPGRDLFLPVGGPEAYAGSGEEMNFRKAVDRIVELLLEIQSLVPDFPRSIRDIGVKKEDLDRLAASPCSVLGVGDFSSPDARHILDKAWETRF